MVMIVLHIIPILSNRTPKRPNLIQSNYTPLPPKRKKFRQKRKITALPILSMPMILISSLNTGCKLKQPDPILTPIH